MACAQFGAQVIGSDIDYLMVHARTKPSRKGQKKRKGESFKGNFQQYQLESKLIDVIVGDASNDSWSSNIEFDAIGMYFYLDNVGILFWGQISTFLELSVAFIFGA